MVLLTVDGAKINGGRSQQVSQSDCFLAVGKARLYCEHSRKLIKRKCLCQSLLRILAEQPHSRWRLIPCGLFQLPARSVLSGCRNSGSSATRLGPRFLQRVKVEFLPLPHLRTFSMIPLLEVFCLQMLLHRFCSFV